MAINYNDDVLTAREALDVLLTPANNVFDLLKVKQKDGTITQLPLSLRGITSRYVYGVGYNPFDYNIDVWGFKLKPKDLIIEFIDGAVCLYANQDLSIYKKFFTKGSKGQVVHENLYKKVGYTLLKAGNKELGKARRLAAGSGRVGDKKRKR